MSWEPRGKQRSFLGVYDTLLKTVQLDYACCDRFEASGYSEFAGKLYTLNANMFQNAAFCDRMLTQMALHYLTWFQDPGMQLVVGPGAAWHVRSDFRTQRYGDALYVVSAEPGAKVGVGETIVRVNGRTLDELRPEVERTLWTTVEPADPEREDWSVVLAFARDFTVRGADGGERTVKLDDVREDAFEGEVSAGEGAAGVGVGIASEAASAAPCSFAEADGVGVLTLREPAAPTFGEALTALLPAARAMERLVIDVRGCRGGVQGNIYPLVPLVLAPGAASVAPAQLFGPAGIIMNCSRHNVDAKLTELAALRGQVAATASGETATNDGLATELDALEADLRAKRGHGFVREMCDPQDGFYPEGLTFDAAPLSAGVSGREVVILADRFTGEAAEWLVRAVHQAGHATIMGRATLGSLDTTCPRTVRLDEDFSLVVPTATYVAAHEGLATLGRGIVPDIHLAWTPEALVRDADLEAAREYVYAAAR